jgi:flagellar biosynthesis GTPase FlhF
MRQRLSWDEAKVAEITKQADPYTMNQTRQNPPVEKYRTGDPSAWGEEPNKATPWKTEGRAETGHPAPAREAVVQARKLEDKALKCLTIAQRMLPGADETMMEDQATDLMFLPERSIMATLQRQSDLAAKIAADSKKDEKDEEEEVSAAKAKKDEEEEVSAAKKDKKEEEVVESKKDDKEEKKEEVVESKKDDKKEEKKEEVVESKKDNKKEEVKEEVVEAKKEEPKKEEATPPVPKKADDLLDIIFDSAEIMPQEVKTGAKKLSGLVKQASGNDPLEGIWEGAPDVSAIFGKNR